MTSSTPARRTAFHRSAWQIFRMPLLVAVISAAGLAFALFGDGIWDALSWLALSLPIGLVLYYGWGARLRQARAN